MATVYLALGSNVGDSRKFIAQAVELLGAELAHVTVAPLYTSKAMGYTDQADFFNTALRAETELTPAELLRFVKSVENTIGRIERFRWGPREIDIDIIFYDEQIIDTPELTVPHPRFAERDFVLQPLCDLNAELIDPLSKHTVSQLLAKLPASQLNILGEQ